MTCVGLLAYYDGKVVNSIFENICVTNLVPAVIDRYSIDINSRPIVDSFNEIFCTQFLVVLVGIKLSIHPFSMRTTVGPR